MNKNTVFIPERVEIPCVKKNSNYREKHEKYTFELFKNGMAQPKPENLNHIPDDKFTIGIIELSFELATLFMEHYEIRTQEASKIHE